MCSDVRICLPSESRMRRAWPMHIRLKLASFGVRVRAIRMQHANTAAAPHFDAICKIEFVEFNMCHELRIHTHQPIDK